jgi:arylsulfatase A-like enzyme
VGPNIVVFFLDDHAQWAVGCYGNREVRTPTLDHLAATGVRMANAFTPTPVCSPARASFWTGMTASQHGVHDYLDVWDPEIGAHDWLDGLPTLAERLQEAGYLTGMVGKWHLGRADEPRPAFDYWYEPGTGAGPHFRSPWSDEAKPRSGRHAITDHAVEFLRHREDDRPFFLFVGLDATHSPWTGHPERLVEQYRAASFGDAPLEPTHPIGQPVAESWMPTRRNPRETLAQYYASVTEVDEQVGRLLDELDDHGLRDETLVVYTSDHGLNLGQHGLWGKGNATHPYNMLEESIRVPLIVNQGDALLAPQVRTEPVTHCDLHRTILAVAGIDEPNTRAGQRLPGRGFDGLLDGTGAGEWPDAVFGEYGTVRMVRTSSHKLLTRPEGPIELYDLRADPRERTNLADDPDHAETLDRLRARLGDYFARHADPQRSGLRVAELPRHNAEEVWRRPGTVHRWWERS